MEMSGGRTVQSKEHRQRALDRVKKPMVIPLMGPASLSSEISRLSTHSAPLTLSASAPLTAQPFASALTASTPHPCASAQTTLTPLPCAQTTSTTQSSAQTTSTTHLNPLTETTDETGLGHDEAVAALVADSTNISINKSTVSSRTIKTFSSSSKVRSGDFKRDVDERPDNPTLDKYRSVPIDEFGAALLRGMGWIDGKAVGRNAKNALLEPRVFEPRPQLLGLGAQPKPPELTRKKERKYIKPGETREPVRVSFRCTFGISRMIKVSNSLARRELPRKESLTLT